ncbi:MAG: hypothetical protein ABEH59_07505 [Halobacteriales archaeon]
MSDDTESMTEESATDGGSSRLPADTDDARRYLMWTAVALLALLAVVATFRVYTSASSAIARFVAYEYRALFQAVFNLAVLLLAVAGIIALLRRLQAAS